MSKTGATSAATATIPQSLSGKTLTDTLMGTTLQSISATARDITLTASTNFLVDESLEVGSTSTFEVPATSTLEVQPPPISQANPLQANQIATSAIKLGYISTTSNFITSSATAAQVTGLTLTVSVPPGGRSIKLTAILGNISIDTATTTPILTIWDGVVGSGTQVGQARGASQATAGFFTAATCIIVLTPAVGQKTYNVGLASTAANQITAGAAATAPNIFLIEAI